MKPTKRTGISADLLLNALVRPNSIAELTAVEWDLLLRLARSARLLPRLARAADDLGLVERLPQIVRQHFAAASAVAASHEDTVRWEIDRIEWALGSLDIPIILLKGAAYVAARLPPARGRLVSDVDIMVPVDALDAVHAALLDHGWEEVKLDPYDQRYFRQWMHEIAPLRHGERGTDVDVHHTILPRTSRLKPDPKKLWAAVSGLESPHLFTLAPVDMVLHSAALNFHDGELNLAIRDVLDVNDLLIHFGAHDGFWDDLFPRARELDLTRPLFYALRYANRLLDAQVPERVMRAAENFAPVRPVLAVMDRLVPRVLVPDHPDRPSGATGNAVLLLYARSHWLKMPPLLLASHLTRKAFMNLW